jgi:hypothetical protein
MTPRRKPKNRVAARQKGTLTLLLPSGLLSKAVTWPRPKPPGKPASWRW